MKYLLFVALAAAGLTWSLPAGAQTKDEFVVSLHKEKLSLPAGSPWRVTQVLDARADRRLGEVRKGIDNHLVPARLAQPLPAELLGLLAQQPAVPGAHAVALRVLVLAVGEDLRATSETGEAELVADFLEILPDSTYRVLLPVGELLRRGGLDVTRQHPANVASLLQTALQQLAAVPPGTPAPETLSAAAARAGQGGAAARRYAASSGPPAQDHATYRTLADFRDRTPDPQARVFEVKYPARPSERQRATGEVKADYLDPNGDYSHLPVRDAWGLRDNGQDYIAYGGLFYPLRAAADGRTMTFVGPPVYDAQKATQAAVVGGLLGGAIGGAVAGAAAGAGAAPATYEVHLATGRVLPAAEFQPAAGAVDSTVAYVFRRADKARATEEWNVQLNGKLAGILYNQGWLRLAWTSSGELPLCVQLRPAGPVAPGCLPVRPDFRQPLYFEALPGAGGRLELRAVTAREGKFQLQRLGLTSAN